MACSLDETSGAEMGVINYTSMSPKFLRVPNALSHSGEGMTASRGVVW